MYFISFGYITTYLIPLLACMLSSLPHMLFDFHIKMNVSIYVYAYSNVTLLLIFYSPYFYATVHLQYFAWLESKLVYGQYFGDYSPKFVGIYCFTYLVRHIYVMFQTTAV